MIHLKFIPLFVGLTILIQDSTSRPSLMTGPCKQAADIIFVVDTSSSIWPVHFNKHVKTFLKDVIASFNIGPGPLDTRVGILLFSTREYLEFHLNTYETVNDTLKAVDAIRFRGGDTYTNKALEYAARTMLTSEHGAREGVAKLLVVLTDGRSANKKKTEDAAKALKARGVDIFSIGVGNGVDFKELYAMASSPVKQFVFQVTDFRALDNIKKSFKQSTCDVLSTTVMTSTLSTTTTTTTTPSTTTPTTTTTTTPTTTSTTASTTTPTTTSTTASTTTPTTTSTTASTTTPTTTPTTASTTTPTTTSTPTTTTTPSTTTATTTTATSPTSTTVKATTKKPYKTTEELPQDDGFDEGCRGKPADIYFLLDASSSVWIHHFHDRVLPFVRDLVSSFHISPLHTRVGLVTFSDDVNHEFGLATHENIESLKAALQPEHVDYLTGGTNTGDAISYVVKTGFGPSEGRGGVAQIIITVTDGQSQYPAKTAEAAADARRRGVYMFAVGVGDKVDAKELSDISSDPDEDFVFHVDEFKALSSVTQLLAVKTCKAVSDEANKKPKCSKSPTNVMFLYEYLHSAASSKFILDDLVTKFTADAEVVAPHVKIGTMTQPCIGEGTSLLGLSKFQEALSSIRGRYAVGYPSLVSKLRMNVFSQVPDSEQKVVVMVVDAATQNLDLIQTEVDRLKLMNVKVIVVAVGKVDEAAVQKLASEPLKQNLIRIERYVHMIDMKLDVEAMICNDSKGEKLIGHSDDKDGKKIQLPSSNVANVIVTQGKSDKYVVNTNLEGYPSGVKENEPTIVVQQETEDNRQPGSKLEGDSQSENDPADVTTGNNQQDVTESSGQEHNIPRDDGSVDGEVNDDEPRLFVDYSKTFDYVDVTPV